MANTWFRMYNNFMDDPKMLSLAFEDQRHFVGILALKSAGTLDQTYPSDAILDRVVAQRLWLNFETISDVKKRLHEVGLIDFNWQPIAWEKRQFKSDTSAERTRKYRENKDKSQSVQNVTSQQPSQKRHSDALDTDTDTDKTHVQNEFEREFLAFWNAYPKKQNKKKAHSAFKSLTKAKRKQAMADIQTRFVGVEKRYIPLPTTYLNGERWEDENNDEPKTFGRVVR